jgi:hypothetical protein
VMPAAISALASHLRIVVCFIVVLAAPKAAIAQATREMMPCVVKLGPDARALVPNPSQGGCLALWGLKNNN